MEFVQSILNGVIDGSVIAVAALGITLIFGISRFANVAHGDLMTLGAYVALLVNRTFAANFVVATAAAMAFGVLAAIVVYRVVFRPVERGSIVTLLITSIGLALVIRNGIAFLWGFNIQGYNIPPQRPWQFLGLRATPTEVAILAASLVCMAAFFILLRGTRLGREMRAVSDLPDLARVTGINSHSVIQWTWIWAMLTASLAGVLLGAKTVLTPNLGWDLLLPAFAAAILGGIGNPLGAVTGAFIVGVSEELSTYVIAESYKQAAAFAILILALLWRPGGLFGRRVRT